MRSALVKRVCYWEFFQIFFSPLSLLGGADLRVGAEPGAVPDGSVPVPLLPGQPAGRGAAQPQAAAGLRQPPHQGGHGPPGHLLRLVLPCSGEWARGWAQQDSLLPEG